MRVALIAALVLLLGGPAAFAEEVVPHLGAKLDVPVCGGFLGLICGDTQWCDYPAGATCGIGGQYGTCRARPGNCTKEYLPVCGCNAKTYGNACEAANAGFDVAYPGRCRGDEGGK